jgi:competence protein ComEC
MAGSCSIDGRARKQGRAAEVTSQDSAGAAGGVVRTVARAGSRNLLSLLRFHLARATGRFSTLLAEEVERGTAFLLVPLAFGGGALAYYLAPAEMSLAGISVAALLCAGLMIPVRGSFIRTLIVGLLIACMGALAAKIEVWRLSTPMLGSEVTTRLTGRVVAVEHLANGRIRLTVDVVETERPRLRHAPDRVRLTAHALPVGLAPGDGVAGVVRLFPPPGPVRPDGYDFAFESYFEGRGAIGFFMGTPERISLGQPLTIRQWLAARIEGLRLEIADRVRAVLDRPEAEIAAALLTGIRGGIDEATSEALRKTGLAHVLAISGLHMALVAGLVMAGARLAIAFFPRFASSFPSKKLAAALALAAAALYLLISGAEVAARRAFIMLAVMLVALLFDRAAITMRNLAIAALIVLAWSPHEIMGPSFQMSFAATAALVAAYAAWSERRRARPRTDPVSKGPAGRLVVGSSRLVAAIAFTALIAGTATAIFGFWHFNRLTPLSLPANLAAMPIVSLIIMPAAIISMMAMPFGLEQFPLFIMGEGISLMLAIAHALAELSPLDAVGLMPPSALAVFTLALLAATIPSTRLRWLGLPLAMGGLALLANRALPEILVAEDGRLLAVVTPAQGLAVNRKRPNGFTLENWLRASMAGEAVPPREDGVAAAHHDADEHSAFLCRDGLCRIRHASGALIVHAGTGDAARPLCKTAILIVVADATAKNVCPDDGAAVMTERDLARKGAVSALIRNSDAGQKITIRHAISEPLRPWHVHRAYSRAARGLPPWQPRNAH